MNHSVKSVEKVEAALVLDGMASQPWRWCSLHFSLARMPEFYASCQHNAWLLLVLTRSFHFLTAK